MWLLFAALLSGRGPEPELGEDEVQRLVDAARGGDSRAANRLYELFVERVYRAVRPLCVSEAEAEDVTQDTFVRVLTSLGRYRRREDIRFVAWLMTVALNAARNRARRRRATPVDPATLDPMREQPSDDDPMGRAEDRRRMRARLLEALSELSERDRRVISLTYGAGLESAEVAALTGLTAANVRKICERGRARLLERLASEVSVEEARP